MDNEFSGLLKRERASLNEMRANVKRVTGVPVEQISTRSLRKSRSPKRIRIPRWQQLLR